MVVEVKPAPAHSETHLQDLAVSFGSAYPNYAVRCPGPETQLARIATACLKSFGSSLLSFFANPVLVVVNSA